MRIRKTASINFECELKPIDQYRLEENVEIHRLLKIRATFAVSDIADNVSTGNILSTLL